MKLQDAFKKQNRIWLYIGVALVGVILIFFFVRGSGGGGAQVIQTGPSEGLQAENLRAQTALQQAQIAAGVQSAGIAAEMQALQFQGQVMAEMAGLEADTRLSLANMQQQTELAAMQASLAAFETEMFTRRDIELAGIGAQENIQLATLSTQEAISIANIQGQLGMQQIAAESMIAQQGISAGLLANIERQRAEVDIARIDADTRQAQIAASSQRSSQRTNLIGSIIGGAFSLFSDVRVKRNITWLGIRDDGLNVYSWEYADGSKGAGVMAQEVQIAKPHAISQAGGYLTVNYEAL
jgi:hypothetical protein